MGHRVQSQRPAAHQELFQVLLTAERQKAVAALQVRGRGTRNVAMLKHSRERALEGCTLPLLPSAVSQTAQLGLEMVINLCQTQ